MSHYGIKVDATTIRFERDLPGPIEHVWAYLVEPEKRALWFAGGEIELKPGGNLHLVFHNGALAPEGELPPPAHAEHADSIVSEGRVLQADPPRLLVFEWPTGAGTMSEVRFELQPRGDRVVLTLTESRLPTRESLVGNAGGWHVHLDVLAARLDDRPVREFWAAIERVEQDYERRLAVS